MSMYHQQQIPCEGAIAIIDQQIERFEDKCLRTVSRWSGYLAFAAVWAAIIWWVAQ
ncbi:hypothetical protein [Aquisediminimonas sediminicola]|uniref:hypothetical protein n=1 Tax=Alteraquisediminimonas sediminicola TaxID=2676787 RepID=UPI001C8E1F87|nr:hypothetical protein [Aquisediminimonas sediminicola]